MPSAAVMLGSTLFGFIATFSPLAANGQVVDDEVIGGTEKKVDVPAPDPATLSPASFERLLESGAASPAMLRDRMELRLLTNLEAVRKRCELNEAQCERLKLAGQRDIARLIEVVDQLRTTYVGVKQPAEKTARLPIEVYRQITIPSLQQFNDRSLFRKVARRHLSAPQWVQYVAFDREQQEEAASKAITYFFGSGRELTKSQEQAMSRLFLDKYPEWRPISTHIPSSECVAALIAGELEAELKPILSDPQWRHLQGYAFLAKRSEPQLVKLGLWPIPEEPKPKD